MKYSTLVFSLLTLAVSCGDGLVDHSKVESTTKKNTSDPKEYKIAENADAIFDAEDVGTCPAATWTDSAGNNDLTLTCGAGGKTGTGTTADPYRVNFDGTATFANGAYTPDQATTPNTTWIVVMRPTATNFAHVLSTDDHGGAFNRSLIHDTSYILFTGSSWDSNIAEVGSQWKFVAATFSATNSSITVNDDDESQGSAPTITDPALAFTIGRSAGGNFDWFTGDIGWVGVYNRVLTEDEIEDTCMALKTRFPNITCDD